MDSEFRTIALDGDQKTKVLHMENGNDPKQKGIEPTKHVNVCCCDTLYTIKHSTANMRKQRQHKNNENKATNQSDGHALKNCAPTCLFNINTPL